MNGQRFEWLLEAVSPLISRKDATMRDSIPPAEQLECNFSISAILFHWRRPHMDGNTLFYLRCVRDYENLKLILTPC